MVGTTVGGSVGARKSGGHGGGAHEGGSAEPVHDEVNHPTHYTRYPVEVIELTEHMNFCRGNVVKYVARAGVKHPATALQDLRKAAWYLQREIERLENNG